MTALIYGSFFSYEGALIHGRLLFMAVYGNQSIDFFLLETRFTKHGSRTTWILICGDLGGE